MAKGSIAKQEVFNKILEVFPGSFMQDDRILRIPCSEGGETVEIKVTLTAAKDILGAGAGSVAGPTAVNETFNWDDAPASVDAAAAQKLTDQEKENVRKMMEALGL